MFLCVISQRFKLKSSAPTGIICQVRNKGGGRPGGRPAFNWKEKKLLQLNQEKVVPKFLPTGYIYSEQEFNQMVDTSRGDVAYNLSTMADFEDGEVTVPYNKKKVQVSSLFGSHKSYGLLDEHSHIKKLNRKLIKQKMKADIKKITKKSNA